MVYRWMQLFSDKNCGALAQTNTHTHTMDICRRTTISKVTLETGSMKIIRNVSDV